uniref:Ig-like domain-containing protein n=1 Tax=Lepisosteus oculatus TaxID=7918 RepID=W5MFM5_LEPOC
SISPQQTKVSKTEGESVTLHCSYSKSSSNYYYLYWYRQYPRQSPEFILYRGESERSDTKADFAKERFSSSTTDKSTALTIQTLTLSDTAVYYCALRQAQHENSLQVCTKTLTPISSQDLLLMCFLVGADSADEVTQTPRAQEVSEGDSVRIQCSYTVTNFYAMQWYKQSKNNGIQYINKATGSSTYGDVSDKYKPAVDTSKKTGSLTIKPTMADSAIYYCAIEPSTVIQRSISPLQKPSST